MGIIAAIRATARYHWVLSRLIFYDETYEQVCVRAFPDDLWARVQLFSLGLIFRLWDKPHYRTTSYQQDMLDNLRNVAIPGTGIPLSIFCYYKTVALWFVMCVAPFACFCGALNKGRLQFQSDSSILNFFRVVLTH